MTGRLRDIFSHSAAYGARISDETPDGPAASPLHPADDKLLGWARSFWDESDERDFDWDSEPGRKVRHRVSGEVFRICVGHPVGGELASDIATFCVRDRRLVLLSRPGSERPTVTTFGYYDLVAREASSAPARPVDGEAMEIW